MEHPFEDGHLRRAHKSDDFVPLEQIADPGLNPEEALIAKQEAAHKKLNGEIELDSEEDAGPLDANQGSDHDLSERFALEDRHEDQRWDARMGKGVAGLDDEPYIDSTHDELVGKFEGMSEADKLAAKKLKMEGAYYGTAQGKHGKEPPDKHAKGAETIRRPQA